MCLNKSFVAPAIRSLAFFLFMGYELHAQSETNQSKIIFFDDFRDNKNNWTVIANKNESGRIEGGKYYLTATGHAYGEAQPIKIDTKKDFEIEARIKIDEGNPEHKDYYSMLFWGREGNDAYYFTFAKDGFASIEICSDKNQSSCAIQDESLKKSNLNPDDFNTYTIRKIGQNYFFLINAEPLYKMPFVPFFGNLIGFGAGRKTTLEIEYLKVAYL